MADKEKAETTIRIYKSTKDKLKELKFGNEGDAVVVARLIEENKQLKEEKLKLYEILSVANVPNIRIKTFTEIIESVINGSSADQLQVLKDFFNSDVLTVEPIEVKEAVEIVKNNYGESDSPQVLKDFEFYVNGNH